MTNDSYDIIREYWLLKDDILFPFDNAVIEKFPNERDALLAKRQRYEQIIANLNRITAADISQCRKNVLLAIEKVLEIISASKLGFPLARDQGLIIENYVYGKLLNVIMSAVKTPLGYGYSNFYYERDGTFDATPLIGVLRTYKEEVENREFNNYGEFADLFEIYKVKILKMWEDDNRRVGSVHH